MDYGNLLSRAWQITWKHKVLWIFGILAGSAGGGFRFNGGMTNFGGGSNSTGSPLPPDLRAQLSRPETLAIIGAIACVVFVIAILFFLLGIVARGGLIGGIKQAADTGSVTFHEAWSIGTRHFLRLLGIGLLLAVPAILIAVVFGGLALVTGGLALICLLPLLCLIVPAYIVAAILAYFAQLAVVLEDLRVMDAFRRGWAVLKSNVGPIIITGIIVLIIDGIIGFVISIPLLLIVIPTALAMILGSSNQPNLGALAVGGVAFICYLPILIVLSGILNTWATAVWTMLYSQLTGSSPAPATPAPVVAPL